MATGSRRAREKQPGDIQFFIVTGAQQAIQPFQSALLQQALDRTALRPASARPPPATPKPISATQTTRSATSFIIQTAACIRSLAHQQTDTALQDNKPPIVPVFQQTALAGKLREDKNPHQAGFLLIAGGISSRPR
jgi:hypothetical protein